ncbi:hypothetical protein F4782DRAFT_530588 [Xylaria castorea]|nr:hypothetical protein F4782DRAFT_530588 [Xylaria castorea]
MSVSLSVVVISKHITIFLSKEDRGGLNPGLILFNIRQELSTENEMASRQEPQVSYHERDSIPTDRNVTKLTAVHKKARPSINVKLAQDYREQEDLPPIKQGDPELRRVHENLPNPELEYVQVLIDEGLKTDQHSLGDQPGSEVADEGPPRDHVTGRMLSEYGRSCQRCTEKGLRCTFNFVGKETEPQCAACRRSKVPYCVRFQPPREDKRSIPFNGPPWKNPNFVAGTAEDGTTADLPHRDLENLLREFYHGESGYVLGNYVAASDVSNYVLPPFNGVDLPLADRPENYETMDWKDVLPDWRNRSLRPRQGEGDEEDEREKQRRKLAMARDQSLMPANPTEEEDAKEEAEEKKGRNILMTQVVGKSENSDDEISFLRILRRYEPRDRNLDDVMGETW